MVTAPRILIALSTLTAMALLVATSAAQTPPVKTQQAGLATVTTEQMSGEVVKVEGNTLIVKLSTGELRTFSNVPDSERPSLTAKKWACAS